MRIGLGVALALLLAAPGAHAATRCEEPAGRGWQRATPEQVGMDPARLARAMDYGSSRLSFAVRVIRHGCLVGEDDLAPVNRLARYESFSMAKSMVALAFMRATTMGLIRPEDPLGALVPEADATHGRIRMLDLATQTSGLRWNFFRDFDIFMYDRLAESLHVPSDHEPGTYWEYSQSGPFLLGEAVARAAGTDLQTFVQRELFGPIGIPRDAWTWTKDGRGRTQGFFGLQMLPDDYARLGELMRRDGVWRGRRLLAHDLVRRAITPLRQNGCQGWLIWVNRGRPCVGSRVVDRPVDERPMYPGLPTDMYEYNGLLGQIIAVFPGQDLLVVRTGLDTPVPIGSWSAELHRQILGSITDQRIPLPDAPVAADAVSRDDLDRGIFNALLRPDEYVEGFLPPPLPPAGPARARAVFPEVVSSRAGRTGRITVRVACPPEHPGRIKRCRGEARLRGARRPAAFDVAPGAAATLKLRLTERSLRSLRRSVRKRYVLTAASEDAAGGTTVDAEATVVRPRR